MVWKKKMRRIIAAFFTLMVCLFGGSDTQAAGMVEEVAAKIDAAAPIPVLVRRRMETTVSAIGAQLLAGRQIADVEASRAQQEAVIHEVFDKVLVGYSVERVSLTPGETSVVEIRLVPWADVIRAVHVDVTVEGMPPLVEEMARREAKVALTVYPKLSVVRTVDLSMRSDSVPNFTLLGHRNIMQENANMLIGVPVAFVERHEAEFSEMFAASLDSQSDFRALGLHTKVTMRPGRDMSLMSRSDTKDYLIRLEGWADISHKDADGNYTMFRFHAGKRFSPRDELFVQTDVVPQDVHWTWAVGYTRHLADATRLIARYDMRGEKMILGGEQEIGRKWMLRYEYRWTDQMGEGAIRYRLHDFLSLEYIIDKKDKWVRVIGNF